MIELPVSFLRSFMRQLGKHGLDTKRINLLEKHYGIYIEDLCGVHDNEIKMIDQFGRGGLRQLREALRSLLRECKERYNAQTSEEKHSQD